MFFIEINRNQTELEDVLETGKERPTRPRLTQKSTDEPIGMDSLTIIWYLTTFTALLGFFIVMACTEKTCTRSQLTKPPDTTCPPTPCPSYKNFAPPSYETVMKKFKNQRIFIVPVHDGNSFFNQSDNSLHQTTLTSVDVEKGTAVSVR